MALSMSFAILPKILISHSIAAHKERTTRQEVCALSLQLFVNLQELIATHRLPSSQLQAHHQSRSQSSDTTSAHHAGHVPRHLWSLLGHVFGKSKSKSKPSLSTKHLPKSVLYPQFNTYHNALARCPHCRKVSSVGSRFANSRGILFAIVALLFLVGSIGLTVGTISYASVTTNRQQINGEQH